MNNQNAYKPPFTVTNKIIALVADIVEKVTKFEYIESKIITPTLRKKYTIETIVGTLEIEGNSLGKEKVTAILDGKRVLGSVKEIEEVKGAIKVYEMLDQFRAGEIEDLLLAHKILMKEILTDAGNFREKSVGIGSGNTIVHIAPPASQVHTLMYDLFSWLNSSDLHPLIKSCVFHYELEFIHPFIDGNGRIGRLWQTLILHSYKPFFSYLPVESVIKEHQHKYYDVLEECGAAGECTSFIEFMLEILNEAIERVNVSDNTTDQVNDQVSDQVKRLLTIMSNSWMTRNEMMQILGLTHNPTFRKNYLKPALELKLIEMYDPNNIRTPNQKYKLTSNGKTMKSVLALEK